MNKVIIKGGITKDAAIREYGKEGKKLADFTLAVSNGKKKEDGSYDADFINVVYFGVSDKLAEYLKKGAQILVEGRAQTSSRVVGKKDGKNIWSNDYKVVAEKIELCGAVKAAKKEDSVDELD